VSPPAPQVLPWAIVLAGGVGSRFWPVSTPQRPKQLLPLVTDAPMLVDTLERLAPLVPLERTLLLTNASIVESILAATPIPIEHILVEPRPAGTAAALTWAALAVEQRAGPAAPMICVHADWAIGDAEAFRTALAKAADAAVRFQRLVTIGIVPVRPDIGYGYLKPGPEVGPGVFAVDRFVEKPDRARAERLVAEGFLWNSGIFAWRAGDFLAEVRARAPEIAPALAHADDANAFFGAVTKPLAVDVAVLERTDKILGIRGAFAWDDVGTWAALRRVRACDPNGNALHGAVHVHDAEGNVVHAEGSSVVLYGVRDLVVVTHSGLTLVTTIDGAADLKKLLDRLPESLRGPTA
jgi:mannose-1-phosphate guanylyltransferase